MQFIAYGTISWLFPVIIAVSLIDYEHYNKSSINVTPNLLGLFND